MAEYKIDDFKTAQGIAKPVTPEEKAKDELGYTHPNLHTRIDPQQPTDPKEVRPKEYMLGVYDGINLYRTVQTSYHDEESTTCEIP